jgi:UDP-glucose 4-epimerase
MRYVVTGGAGRTGGALVARLAALEDTELVAIADVRPAPLNLQNVDCDLVDVRNAEQIANAIQRRRPDAVVHLATSHDSVDGREAMYETNVVGTNAVMAAVGSAETAQVVVVSSAACYAVDGVAEPVVESAPLRANLESELARDRATVDRLAQLWAARQPDKTMTIVRPCAVIGSGPDDSTAGLFTEPPHCARLADPDAAVQLLHEDDFVDALVALVGGRHGGVFNIAGEGSVSLGECAEMVGLKSRRGPLKAYSKARSRKGTRGSLEDLELLVGTPIVATERLRTTSGWAPRHTSRGAFEATMGERGKLVATPATTPLVANAVPERS